MEEGVFGENTDSLLTGGEGGWGLRARDLGYGRNGMRFILTVLEDRGKYWLYLDSSVGAVG